MTTLQVLLDKQEITELLTRYLRSVSSSGTGTADPVYTPR